MIKKKGGARNKRQRPYRTSPLKRQPIYYPTPPSTTAFRTTIHLYPPSGGLHTSSPSSSLRARMLGDPRQVIEGLDILSFPPRVGLVREDGGTDHDGILRVATIDVEGERMARGLSGNRDCVNARSRRLFRLEYKSSLPCPLSHRSASWQG